jgi:hypothetical protein
MRPPSDSVGGGKGTLWVGTRRSSDSRSFLESAINGFETLKRFEQLHAGFAGLVCGQHELFRVLDREPDAVDSDARLVSHFELDA